jgi:hypothetical protein
MNKEARAEIIIFFFIVLAARAAFYYIYNVCRVYIVLTILLLIIIISLNINWIIHLGIAEIVDAAPLDEPMIHKFANKFRIQAGRLEMGSGK